MTWQERLDDARAEGVEAGELKFAVELVKDGVLTVEDAAERLGVPIDDIREAMAAEK